MVAHTVQTLAARGFKRVRVKASGLCNLIVLLLRRMDQSPLPGGGSSYNTRMCSASVLNLRAGSSTSPHSVHRSNSLGPFIGPSVQFIGSDSSGPIHRVQFIGSSSLGPIHWVQFIGSIHSSTQTPRI